MIAKESELKSDDLCALALDCYEVKNPDFNWTINLNQTKPPIIPFQPPEVILYHFKIKDI